MLTFLHISYKILALRTMRQANRPFTPRRFVRYEVLQERSSR